MVDVDMDKFTTLFAGMPIMPEEKMPQSCPECGSDEFYRDEQRQAFLVSRTTYRFHCKSCGVTGDGDNLVGLCIWTKDEEGLPEDWWTI